MISKRWTMENSKPSPARFATNRCSRIFSIGSLNLALSSNLKSNGCDDPCSRVSHLSNLPAVSAGSADSDIGAAGHLRCVTLAIELQVPDQSALPAHERVSQTVQRVEKGRGRSDRAAVRTELTGA